MSQIVLTKNDKSDFKEFYMGEDGKVATYPDKSLDWEEVQEAAILTDSTKLQRELGWEPSLQFEEGIERTVRWYLDNEEWLNNITSGEYEKYYESMYSGR